MEEDKINQIQNKNIKIKIRNYTSLEYILEELKQQQFQNEFCLSFKFCDQPNLFMNQITQLLCQFQNLYKLLIKIDRVINFSISELLNNLKKLKQLESLSMIFLNKIIISENDQISLGESIEDLENLQSLHLKINCVGLPQQSHFLKLKSAYQKLKKLNLLYLSCLNISKNSCNLLFLFEGMSSLTNLNSLTIKLINSNAKQDKGLIILQEELKHLINLRIFKLFDDSYSDSSSFLAATSIQFLSHLEQLKLCIPIFHQEYDQCLDGIQKLTKLKYLKFSTIFATKMEIVLNYLEIISQTESLQDIDLNLTLEDEDCDENKDSLNLFNQYLLKIQHISKLKIKNYYNNSLINSTLIELLKSLKNQIHTKSLDFFYHQNKENKANLNDNYIQEISSTLTNLEVFSIYIYNNFNENKEQQLPIDFWISILKEISQLKSLSIWSLGQNRGKDERCSINLDGFLQKINNLEKLTLYFGRNYIFEEADLFRLFGNIQKQTNLKSFKFSVLGDDTFNENSLVNLSQSIYQMKNLTQLVINIGQNNKLSRKGIIKFSEALDQLTMLELLQLNLQDLQINKSEQGILLSPIQRLSNLKKLEISFGILEQEIDENIIKQELFIFPLKLKNLILTIKCEKLYFEDIKYILNLKDLKNLKILELDMPLQKQSQMDYPLIYNNLIHLQSITEIKINFEQLILINLHDLFKELKYLNQIKVEQKTRYYSSILFVQYHQRVSIDQQNQEYLKYNGQDIHMDFVYQPTLNIESIKILEDFFSKSELASISIIIQQTNQLDDSLGQKLFSLLHYQHRLQKLNVVIQEFCNIGNNSINQLGKAISHLMHISTFQIEINNIGNNIIFEQKMGFFDGMINLSSLKNLQIILHQSSFNDVAILMNSISQIKQLQSLKFISYNNNQFDYTPFEYNQHSFQNLNDLIIQIKTNNYNDTGKSLFYQKILKIQNIKCIKLNRNEINRKFLCKLRKLVAIQCI